MNSIKKNIRATALHLADDRLLHQSGLLVRDDEGIVSDESIASANAEAKKNYEYVTGICSRKFAKHFCSFPIQSFQFWPDNLKMFLHQAEVFLKKITPKKYLAKWKEATESSLSALINEVDEIASKAKTEITDEEAEFIGSCQKKQQIIKTFVREMGMPEISNFFMKIDKLLKPDSKMSDHKTLPSLTKAVLAEKLNYDAAIFSRYKNGKPTHKCTAFWEKYAGKGKVIEVPDDQKVLKELLDIYRGRHKGSTREIEAIKTVEELRMHLMGSKTSQ